MFKNKTLFWKDALKKLNHELSSNFFNLEEFKQLSPRRAYKVIKLIAKIKKIKFKRSEIKLLAYSLQTINKQTTTGPIVKLFDWLMLTTPKTLSRPNASMIIKMVIYAFLYRRERKEIFRV